MKKSLICLFLCAVFFSVPTATVFARDDVIPTINAKATVLYDVDENRVLLSQNGDCRMGMASTTKIMTALVTLENGNLADRVAVAEDAVGVEGTSLYLKKEETFTLGELVYALLLQSANDVAVAIACHVGGSFEGFVDMMNAKASELGLSDTHFENPHGLDGEKHYTTAKDLAILTAFAIQNPAFCQIVSTKSTVIGDGDSRRLVRNHNKLLSCCDGCFGVKTGFTKKCGRCLVSACERGGKTLICVTLGCPDDWCAHQKLFSYGFSVSKQYDYTEE